MYNIILQDNNWNRIAQNQSKKTNSQTWETKDLERILEQTLFQAENMDFVEDLFLTELTIQRQAKRQGISYDKITRKNMIDTTATLSSTFKDILGIPIPKDNRYFGKLGKAFLTAKLVFKTLIDYQPFNIYSGKGQNFDPITELMIMYHYTLKNLENCYINNNTHCSQQSLQETIIVQAHESYHRVMQPRLKLKQYDIRSLRMIQEGGATHFQVLVNKSLAESTGDQRYRYACREGVLMNIAPLYYLLCRKFERRPIMSEINFMLEAMELLGTAYQESISHQIHHNGGLSRMANDYAKGYALFKLAEEKYHPSEIHRSIENNDPRPLMR